MFFWLFTYREYNSSDISLLVCITQMIKTLTHHYRRIPRLKKLLLWIFFFLGVFIATFKFLYADSIPFEDNLPVIFSGWFNSGYYSNTRFKYWGNDFVGIIFRQASEPGYNEFINIGWTQTINCTEKLRGIYYNNQRGRRIWPLDTGNLNILKTSPLATGYASMTMSNGFFTNCFPISWGFIPASNDVFGQIDHALGTQTGFTMIAWVSYDFTGNVISWSVFDHTLTISSWWVHTGFIFDTNGGIAELNMNMPYCGNFYLIPSPTVVNQWNDITFTCEGNSIGGYMLSIFSWANLVYFDVVSNTGTTQIWTTWHTLATGNYLAACSVLNSWLLYGPQCAQQIPFQIGSGTPPPVTDIIPPTTPYITTPTNGTNFCSYNPFTITRNGSTDTGSQVSHYKYTIYSNSWMVTGVLLSGTTLAPTTTTTINAGLLPIGTHYIMIQAVDNVGIISSWSNIVNITTSPQYCTASTGITIVTPAIWLRNVNLDKVYRSDPIWILGLTGPTLVTISKGMLFLNNNTGGNWTTGMVTSNDTLYIEMISSDEYDTTVVSELHILWLTGTFSLTTKKNECILSAAEKLMIENIYEELKDKYNNNLSQYSEFLNTFQSMVQDEANLSNNCMVDYLLSLIEDDFWSEGGIDTSNHICPNCKEYTIGYDINQRAYYAPQMINRFFFVNRESLIRHLDYYNPGDCHINTYGNDFRTSDNTNPMKHIAPNGKIYHFVGQYGGFSATEFLTAKYFDSLENIIRYIDLRNPAKEIWRHTVNTSFIPIVYAAPNGKEYKIFSTDRWYMSYKLMKVKYYTTLSELKSYINRNNPSKR